MKNRFFLFIFGGWMLGLVGGCISTFSLSDLILGPSPSWETSRVLQKAVQSQPGSRTLEQARIDYLLERVSNSPYNFIRNGQSYSGKRAWAHFKWKYLLNVKRVKTAEEFMDRVATYSQMSGEPYEVQLPDKSRHPLRFLLTNELKLFDQEVEMKRKLMAQTSQEPHPS